MNKAQNRPTLHKVLSMILALVMVLSLLPLSGFTSNDAQPTAESGSDSTDNFYRILHLDCGRKYFTKGWIISLLCEMKADGYNQLQLAFGNDGLRFLLDDMSFTANGTTYSHETVVSKVEAGNAAANSSGDSRWLKQNEMADIIAKANELGIEIVPLLNLPGHANAILDIADDAYNVSGSSNTLDVVSNEGARSFGMAILQKYVDYFADNGCKFFNFGADEYANDIKEGSFSFSRLSDAQYSDFVTFVNNMASYIESKNMTPRAFNDGMYYNGKTASIDTNIQCCYWSSGWSGYSVASASTISGNGHPMINTNGDYYYVIGDADDQSNLTTNAALFSNTQFMGKTISNPVGSMFCIWCDTPTAETETEIAQHVRLAMRAMALRMQNESTDNMDTSVVTNGFNADGKLNTSSTDGGSTGGDTEYTEVPVTLTVGQTSEAYTQNGDVTGNVEKTDFNEAVATIESCEHTQTAGETTKVLGDKDSMSSNGTYTGVISDGSGNYLVIDSSGNISNTTEINEATAFTVTRSSSSYWGTTYYYYTIKGNGYYLYLGSNNALKASSNGNKATSWSYGSSTGFYSSGWSTYYITPSSNTWSASTSPSSYGSLYSVSSKTTESKDVTQITFKGVAVGITSVIIGNVKYNITVTAEDLSKVTPLSIEYWITNSRMTGSDNSQSVTINATDNGVATKEGVNTADLVAKTGAKDGRTQEYWQTKILEVEKKNTSTSGTELQTIKAGDDETLNGEAFTKIRYWDGAWQVYTSDWIDVDCTTTTVSYTVDNVSYTYTGNKNQLVAYYMEVVDIKNSNGTTNLHVNAADWGTKGDGTGNWGYTPESDRCSVSIQLVYPDNNTNPEDTTASALKSKTIVYGYWTGGRGLGTMIFDGQDNYQIIKVTAETGTMSSSANSDNSVTVTSFAWADNAETVWEGDATDSVSIGNPSRSPSYEAPYDNLTWNTSSYNKNNAILIRVYVKAIPKADSLTVNYYERSANGTETWLYNYSINVAENTTFNEHFARVEDSSAVGGAKLVNNTVTNYEGHTQTVQWDLSKMTEIGAQYRYSDYEFVDAKRSTDGKTVNLYYTFNSTKTFVVDFGLPVVITPKDMNANLGNEGVNLTGVTTTDKATYGNIEIDTDTKNVTYKLIKAISAADHFGLEYSGQIPKYRSDGTADGTQQGKVSYSVTIIPASTVYYEDSLATFTDGSAEWKILNNDDEEITKDKVYTSTTQALEALGGENTNVYGYDTAYNNSTKYSLGSAHKVTVTKAMAETENVVWPSATFTFKGTGFDIISLTDNTSGTIFVDVYDSTGVKEKSVFVDNYYGYSYDDVKKEWVVNTSSNNALYQIPVISFTDLTYGEHKVVIRPAYSEWFDNANKKSYSFVLDGIRVYNPMNTNDSYVQDGEGYPQYIKLRDELADEDDGIASSSLVFIDGGNTANIATYANYGPNNEVYLANGQAISFTVPEDLSNLDTVQIGAKSPNGGATMSVTVNNTTKATQTIGTATEMYYKLEATAGQQVTITNTGSNILSLTNLKLTFTKAPTAGTENEITLAAMGTEEQEVAVMAVRTLFAAPTPVVETFEPDTFKVSLSKNSIIAGQKATLTVKASAEVTAITVNGETYDSYKTRYERSGWGWWSEKIEYHVFTITETPTVTTSYDVVAVNDEGAVSEAKTVTLTVKAAQSNWWDNIWNNFFGKWF